MWSALESSHDIHAWFESITDKFNNASYVSIYMPLCVRNVHYVTVVLQKHVTGKTCCYVLDSTGRDNFFSAGRYKTVELLYSYIETTRLRLNPESVATTETDVAGIRNIEDQLKITASMSPTPSVTMKISELAKKLELMKISLRPEIKWLEGIEQDDSFECGLAVAGNIALFERVTKAGKLFVDENFTALCRTMPNEFGGIGYNREAGFPALVEACSIGLSENVHVEKKDHDSNELNLNKPQAPAKSQSRPLIDISKKNSNPSCSKKRKLKQANLLDLFAPSNKQCKRDHK